MHAFGVGHSAREKVYYKYPEVSLGNTGGGNATDGEPQQEITSVVPLSLMPYLSLVFLIFSDVVVMNFLISWNKDASCDPWSNRSKFQWQYLTRVRKKWTIKKDCHSTRMSCDSSQLQVTLKWETEKHSWNNNLPSRTCHLHLSLGHSFALIHSTKWRLGMHSGIRPTLLGLSRIKSARMEEAGALDKHKTKLLEIHFKEAVLIFFLLH